MVDFSFIVSLYISDFTQCNNSTRSSTSSTSGRRGTILIVTLGKSETYKETIKEKSTIEQEGGKFIFGDPMIKTDLALDPPPP